MNDNPILYKKLEPVQIAFILAHVETRDEIPPLFERLQHACGEWISGDFMAIFHGGAVKTGFLIEAAVPVKIGIETSEVHSRMLETVPALSMFHYGPHQTIRETALKIFAYLDQHAWTTTLFRREIYPVLDTAAPEKNITEVQVILHEWERLMAEGAEKVFGVETCRNLMQGFDSITPNSSFVEYTTWIQGAISRLDELTDDDEKKCLVVSNCAHVFPQERIDSLRAVYERENVDGVLREMYSDPFWYEKPVRRGNVLYMRKNPFNPEGYKNATTPVERRRAYCHCSFVSPYLDEIPSRLSPTFCFCGAGWYRRLWEGILGKSVKIVYNETLLRGNDQCTFSISLPLELAGECFPEPS